MSLSKKTVKRIEKLLKDTVLRKLETYTPETEHMPFHYRLLGKDRYAMFSFIHSINTTFGMSIWEKLGEILASDAGYYAKRQYKLLGEIDEETEKVINTILHKLRSGNIEADKEREIEDIRKKIKPGKTKTDPDSVIDLFVKIKDKEFYFDITSVKPNIKEFVALKRKILRWTALRLSQDKKVFVFTGIAIPYNPYHPEPYERWTLKGLFDLKRKEVMVGREFWNFLAGKDIYEELLDIFQKVGQELRPIIDEKFKELRNQFD